VWCVRVRTGPRRRRCVGGSPTYVGRCRGQCTSNNIVVLEIFILHYYHTIRFAVIAVLKVCLGMGKSSHWKIKLIVYIIILCVAIFFWKFVSYVIFRSMQPSLFNCGNLTATESMTGFCFYFYHIYYDDAAKINVHINKLSVFIIRCSCNGGVRIL